MSRPPRYGAWHRSRVIANYRRTGSHTKAAAAAGVSPGWAYGVLKTAGFITPSNRYRTSTMLEARRLYVEEQLSCRLVAARLAAAGHDPAPSQETICQYMRRAGVLRTKSEADVIQNGRRNGRDYHEIEPIARHLAAEKKWSVRRIARHLGVERKTVKVRIAPEDRLGPAEASRRQAWEAATPAARARRERRIRVMRLRMAGKKLREIVDAVGVSLPTVSHWLREEGMTRKIVRHGLANRIRHASVPRET